MSEINVLEAAEHDYDYRTRAELPEDWREYTEVPAGTVVRTPEGEPVAAYGLLGATVTQWAELRHELNSVAWDAPDAKATSQARLSGIKNANRVFGYSEPVPLRRRYGCSRCRFTEEYPKLDQMLEDFANQIDGLFAEIVPDAYANHLAAVEDISPTYRFGGSPFTSGVINHIAALPMHKDAGNCKGAWSAMIGLRRNVTGGELIIPNYRLRIPVADKTITMFNGGDTPHGVTPFSAEGNVNTSTGPRRTTIVFYAKRGITKCLDDLDAELARARKARSDSEDNIAEALND